MKKKLNDDSELMEEFAPINELELDDSFDDVDQENNIPTSLYKDIENELAIHDEEEGSLPYSGYEDMEEYDTGDEFEEAEMGEPYGLYEEEEGDFDAEYEEKLDDEEEELSPAQKLFIARILRKAGLRKVAVQRIIARIIKRRALRRIMRRRALKRLAVRRALRRAILKRAAFRRAAVKGSAKQRIVKRAVARQSVRNLAKNGIHN